MKNRNFWFSYSAYCSREMSRETSENRDIWHNNTYYFFLRKVFWIFYTHKNNYALLIIYSKIKNKNTIEILLIKRKGKMILVYAVSMDSILM